jgi:ABC-type lipoprotein release transport system permease subunit
LTRTIASFLYGVSPADPATAAAVAGVLLAVACLAAFVPARRAANIDPVTALRAEG